MSNGRSRFFYRCCSDTSAGDLRCGRCQTCPDNHTHPALSNEELLCEFKKHQILKSSKPTALISVTDRPLEALKRALGKLHDGGEGADTIFIITIRIPGGEERQGGTRPIHAQEIARKSHDCENSHVFKHEYLFQWEIPEHYVLHCVSLSTLLNRGIKEALGLDLHKGLRFPSFSEMQDALVDKVIGFRVPRVIGRRLGDLAWAIYGEKCTYDLAFRVMVDCFGRYEIDGHGQYVNLNGFNDHEYFEFSDICVIEKRIQKRIRSHLKKGFVR
ncbi:hypothetical protein BDW69DRAFT_52541 [Aspergillus filifer]